MRDAGTTSAVTARLQIVSHKHIKPAAAIFCGPSDATAAAIMTIENAMAGIMYLLLVRK